MTTVDTTPNFKFGLPAFDLRVWHTYINDNFRVVDAVLQQYLSVSNLQGVWLNSTHYLVGQTVVDSTQGVIYTCEVEHTSAAVPTTFAEARDANPSYWGGITTPEHFRGEWAHNTAYSVRDFVVSGAIYAVCITAHTSNAAGAFGDDAINWLYLINASSFNLPSITGKGTYFLRARADETGLEYRSPAQVAADIGAGTGTVTTVNTGVGLSGGPINLAGTISLQDTVVTPGTYNMLGSVTIDQQGRVTAATSAGFASTDVARLSQANNFAADQTITSTDAGATAGPNLVLDRNSASPAASDLAGTMLYRGRSSTGVARDYVTTFMKITSPTNAAESAEWHLQTIDAGALADRVVVSKSSIALTSDALTWNGAAIGGTPGFRNWLLNGAFQVWQRDTGDTASISIAASTVVYTADRWYIATGANQASTVSQQAASGGFRFNCRVQRNSGQTGTGGMVFATPLELPTVAALAGTTCTFSTNVNTGANWSPTSGALRIRVFCGTGAAGKRNGTGYSGETTPIDITTNVPAGSSNINISASGAIPANTTQMEVQYSWSPTGTAGVNDYFAIITAQLEIGSSQSAFDASRLNFVSELAQCQRFYRKSFPYKTAPAQNAGVSGCIQTCTTNTAGVSEIFASWRFGTPMRITPSFTAFNPSAANANWRNITAGSDSGAASFNNSGDEGTLILDATAPNIGSQQVFGIHAVADAEL